jgi:glucosamine--fructose-6-phosphate aminotransferase (isomerizing)
VLETRAEHPHSIWNSMMRTPEMLDACRAEPFRGQVERVADRLAELSPRRAFCAGTGSSYYASIVHAFALEEMAGIPSSWHTTSELGAYPPVHMGPESVLILTSHSGRTIGDLRVVERARQRGTYTIGVTDIPDSPLAQAVDDAVIGPGGRKTELPATRTYTTAIFRVLQLAVSLAKRLDNSNVVATFDEELGQLSHVLREFLDRFSTQAGAYANGLADVERYFVIGAGPNMSTAFEGALVLLQSTDAGAQAFHVEEMLHGPIQALRPGACVVVVAAPGPLQQRIIQSAQACHTIGATVLTVAPEDTPGLQNIGVHVPMPARIPELLTPVLYIVPFWLVGYQFALASGRDPDNLNRDKEEFKSAFRLLMPRDPRFDRPRAVHHHHRPTPGSDSMGVHPCHRLR